MHQSLSLPEILHNILLQLKTEDDLDSDQQPAVRKTLLSVALTCRAFHDSAIDLLWYKLDSVLPLLTCMGSDICKALDTYNRTHIFDAVIYPSHVKALRGYASRVRIFEDNFDPLSDDLPEIWSILHAATGDSLLENVRRAAIHIRGPQDSIKPRLFTGPKLTTFRLMTASSTATHGPQLASFLANMTAERYPQLAEIEILNDLSGRESEAICHALRNLPTVTKLTAGSLHYTALKSLARATCLRELTFTIEKNEWRRKKNAFPKAADPPNFCALQNVTITCPTIASSLNFFELLCTDISLVSLSLETDWELRNSGPNNWEDLFGCLAKKICATSFTKLHIEDHHSDLYETSGQVLVSQACLALLTKFSCLVEIECSAGPGFDLDDSFLKLLAQSFPVIKEFHLIETAAATLPRNTLLGLLVFVEYCPQLVGLTLAFDARNPPHSLSQHINTPSNSKLSELWVQRSPIARPAEVAAFLSNAFPCLTEIVDTGDESSTEPSIQSMWEEVRTSICG